jgi:hypothetical protein
MTMKITRRQDVTFFTFQTSSDTKLQKDVTQFFKGLGDIAYRLSPIAPFDRPPPSFAPNSPLIRLRIEVSSTRKECGLQRLLDYPVPKTPHLPNKTW